MRILTKLQRRILALLEEAGEEEFGTLTNTVARATGTPREIHVMCSALASLLGDGLIEIAQGRDEASLQWISLPRGEALANLQDLNAHVEWIARGGYWKARPEFTATEVLLTDLGLTIRTGCFPKMGGQRIGSRAMNSILPPNGYQ